MYGLKPISGSLKTLSNKTFDRKFMLLGRIIANWTDIVGEKMALKCQPVKIRYRKRKNGEKHNAVLEIATSSANAAKLEYQKGLLVEKLTHILGQPFITAIRLVHTPANNSKRIIKNNITPLTNNQKDGLDSLLNDINDTELKERLEKFGTAFYEDMNRN